MAKFALWKTLYTIGHDAAHLSETDAGHQLEGVAIFSKEGAPACLNYSLQLASDWSTRGGAISGFVGAQRIQLQIEREDGGWRLNGERQPAVDGLVDLDFGFTPATNHPQLRRMALAVGETKQIVVAWMDVGSQCLEPLPQIYRRISEHAYDYDSPQGPYRATLKIASNGFVSDYPELWMMETKHG